MSPRIDSHHHVWDLAVRDQPWTAGLVPLRRSFSMTDLRPELIRHNIAGTVLVETVNVPGETAELLALAASEPAIRGVIGWSDLAAPDIAEQLDRLRALPGGDRLIALRHQVQLEADPAWLGRANVGHGLAAVAAAGLRFDLLVQPHQLACALRTVRRMPQLQFVLEHAGKPAIRSGEDRLWRTHIAPLALESNVAVKLSGLVTEADPTTWTGADLQPFVDTVLTLFGPRRTMFGSDWPVCLLAATYDQVVEVTEALTEQLTASERAEIFGATAARWYGLVVDD
jgi:L-fuconolactonase